MRVAVMIDPLRGRQGKRERTKKQVHTITEQTLACQTGSARQYKNGLEQTPVKLGVLAHNAEKSLDTGRTAAFTRPLPRGPGYHAVAGKKY